MNAFMTKICLVQTKLGLQMALTSPESNRIRIVKLSHAVKVNFTHSWAEVLTRFHWVWNKSIREFMWNTMSYQKTLNIDLEYDPGTNFTREGI